MVNNGRCPKCTLKLPWKHYETFEEVQKDPSNIPKKTENSIFRVTNGALNQSNKISSETTKDYSSIQKYLDNERNKELKYPQRRKLDISCINDINDEILDDQSDPENKSIFTQNLMIQNKTPVKQRLNESMRQELIKEIIPEPIISPWSNPGKFASGGSIITPGTMTEYHKTAYGHKFIRGRTDDSIRMRIRGK